MRLEHLHRLRVSAARKLLFAALGGLSFACFARDTSVQVSLDANTQATATLVGARLHVVLGPGGKEQWFDANLDEGEGGASVDSDDYNFDGHPDLAVSAMLGQVNEAVLVFVFDPAQRRFRALTAPTRPAVQCEGFFNLTPDRQQRSLTSSCRSGPMWYADVYRYAADGRLYVARTQQPIVSPDIQTLLDPGTGDGMPLSVWPSYDARGAKVSSEIGTTLDAPMPVQLRVQVARLPLYATPTATSTKRYLVQGDRADALDVSADATRVQVRYRNAGRGDIVGWIEVAAAMK
ncbi:FG-GAP repeat protein [Xanthomonas arboricola]|uniref:FG-GAP repeat protein n=1 Tax=Xanthomonas arboricola TaxID=56448 RepID=UPI001E28CFF6|nr:FG-GAP repeat protein [Xanthomonas arboricola]MCC8475175.1 FG-GAP repeat protein [Xanthomonas arboricola]